MTVEAGISTLLLADGTVAGLIGTRLYPALLPQNPTYPAVTFERVGASRINSLGGPSGRARPRVRFHCWAQSYGAAKNVAEAIRGALDGYRGAAGSFTLDQSTLESDLDAYDDEADVYRVITDYRLSHAE